MIGGFHKIPEAIKVAIAAETFSETMTVQRRTVLFAESEKAQVLRCVVAPVNQSVESGTRARENFTWTIGVYLIEQVSSSTLAGRQAREDELLTVTDEVMEFLGELRTIVVDGKDHALRLSGLEARRPVDFEAYVTTKTFVSEIFVTVTDK